MFQSFLRGISIALSVGLAVVLIGAFADRGDTGHISTEVAGGTVSTLAIEAQGLARTGADAVVDPADESEATETQAAQTVTSTTTVAAGNTSSTPASTPTTQASTPTTQSSPPTTQSSPPPTTTTTTTTVPAVASESGMRLWDSPWQIAAKADAAGMQQYVDRLAAAKGTGGANITGFWFSVVNQNQDINTPNGFGHSFGSYSSPNPDYLNDVETLIAKASGRGLRVGILVAWDGNSQFSVESGKLNAEDAYQYGYAIASQWTRPDFGGRWAISGWIMGGDTTNDNGGEHGAVWSEVVRGIQDAEAANGFGGAPILFHTAPGQQLYYLGASWLDAHAPQTGHCADTATAVNWMNQLHNTGARVWGNGEMRYEDLAWSCNGNVPISPQQVLADTIAMANLGYMDNFVYGHDARWNSSSPGSAALYSGGGVSPGLQMILDEPGLIRSR